LLLLKSNFIHECWRFYVYLEKKQKELIKKRD
jgi:hypothetical protein